jgi:hypothetical protein
LVERQLAIERLEQVELAQKGAFMIICPYAVSSSMSQDL